jgi:hypothetical protein
MGLKLRGAVRCGRCGKPRGITHTCVTSWAGRGRSQRPRLQSPVTWECPSCGRKRGVLHNCAPGSDFRKRRRDAATAERRRKRKAARERQAARRKQAAADRRARDRARKAAVKGRPRTSRSRGESHEPGTCGDRDCQRYGCKAYWRGVDDCPRLHEGE